MRRAWRCSRKWIKSAETLNRGSSSLGTERFFNYRARHNSSGGRESSRIQNKKHQPGAWGCAGCLWLFGSLGSIGSLPAAQRNTKPLALKQATVLNRSGQEYISIDMKIWQQNPAFIESTSGNPDGSHTCVSHMWRAMSVPAVLAPGRLIDNPAGISKESQVQTSTRSRFLGHHVIRVK